LPRTHGDGFRLDFESAQWAVTPGQSAVLYQGEVCLGGGIIANQQAGSGVSSSEPAAPACP